MYQNFIPFYRWMIWSPCHILFIYHLSVDIWIVSKFWLLWTMLLWVLVYCLNSCFQSFGYTPKSRVIGLYGNFIVTFGRTSTLFSRVTALFHILTSNALLFQFLEFSPTFAIFLFFIVVINGCEVVSHGSFDFHFPNDQWYWAYFIMLTGNLLSSLEKFY